MAFSWGDIGKLIGSAAPIVGTALGGPAGAAVGSMVASYSVWIVLLMP